MFAYMVILREFEFNCVALVDTCCWNGLSDASFAEMVFIKVFLEGRELFSVNLTLESTAC